MAIWPDGLYVAQLELSGMTNSVYLDIINVIFRTDKYYGKHINQVGVIHGASILVNVFTIGRSIVANGYH